MDRMYRECQSCGMPLNKSPHGGGTNADGSISKMYCAYCFEKGEFKQPKWTVHQMQEFIRGSLKATGMQDFQAMAAAKAIPRLERWKLAQPPATQTAVAVPVKTGVAPTKTVEKKKNALKPIQKKKK